MASLAGWDVMATDSSNSIILIAQLRSELIPNAVYYSLFSDGKWIDPPIPFIVDETLNTAHHPQGVISDGNRMHLVLEDYLASEIYYVRGTTSAPDQPTFQNVPQIPIPITTSIPIETPTSITERANNKIEYPEFNGNIPNKANPVAFPVIAGVVPVFLIILSLVIRYYLNRHR